MEITTLAAVADDDADAAEAAACYNRKCEVRSYINANAYACSSSAYCT